MTDPTPLALVLRHLGTLHAYETALVLVIAFGPFIVIVGLVLRERRRSAASKRSEAAEGVAGGPAGTRGRESG